MEQIAATPSSITLSHCEAVSATELRGALSVALVKAHESGLAWLRLLRLAFFPLSCGVQHTAHAIAPYAKRAATAFAQQPRDVLLLEAALVLAIACAIWLRRLLRRKRYCARLREWGAARFYRPVAERYARLAGAVRQRSRLVARLLPHGLYAVGCLAAARLLEAVRLAPMLRPVWPHAATLLLTPVPWVRTLLTLRSDGQEDRALQRSWLMFWVLWASAQLLSEALALLPFAARLLPAQALSLDSPSAAPVLFCAAAWLHLPHSGLPLLYSLVGPVLAARAQRLSDALPALPAGVSAQIGLVLRLLLPAGLYAALAQTAQEGWLLLAAALCLCTPYPLTAYTLLYWSVCHPALRSVEALEAQRHGAEAAADAAFATQVQLRYWLLHCAVSAVLQQLPWLLWLPFSTHGQLVLAVWLQLPYFRAATLIAIRLTPVGRVLLRYIGDGSGAPLLAAGADAASPVAAGSGGRQVHSPLRSPRANALYSKRLLEQPPKAEAEKKPHDD